VEAFVALGLYGIFVAQTYVYAMNCSNDAFYLKFCVTCIAVLETLHSIFVVHMAYGYAIDNFGDIAGIAGHIIWSGGASVASEMIIVAFTQSLYIRRVFILSGGNVALTLLTSVLLFMRVAFGLATAALTYSLNSWGDFRASKGPFFTVIMGLALSSLVDLLIALILMYYLWRNKTGFGKTDNILHALMAYCVNTGLLTMVCSTVTILTFAFMKSSLMFAGFVQISSKLYANSLMGTLNARGMLRHMSTRSRSRFTDGSELGVRFQSQHTTTPRHIEIFQETSKVVATESLDVRHNQDTSYGRGKGEHSSDVESSKGYPLS